MFKEFYSNVFNDDIFGVVTGTPTAHNFPSGVANYVKVKAPSGNSGTVNIGDESNVLYPIEAGDRVTFVPTQSKLQNYWYEGGSNDVLYYWVQR